MRYLLISLALSALLCSSCGSLPTSEQLEVWKTNIDKTVAAGALAADEVKHGLELAKAAQAATEAKIEAAYKELEGKGFDPSSASSLWEGIKKSPVEAASSLGAIALAFAGIAAGYKRKAVAKVQADAAPVVAALNAAVDAIDATPDGPAKTALLAEIASHPQMNGEAMVAVTEARSR